MPRTISPAEHELKARLQDVVDGKYDKRKSLFIDEDHNVACAEPEETAEEEAFRFDYHDPTLFRVKPNDLGIFDVKELDELKTKEQRENATADVIVLVESYTELSAKYNNLFNTAHVLKDGVDQFKDNLADISLQVQQLKEDQERERASHKQKLADVVATENARFVHFATNMQSGEPRERPEKPQQSEKLPDPPMFTGEDDGKDTVLLETWKVDMHAKLVGNADRFLTETNKIAYMVSRIGGDAKRLLLHRLKPGSVDPFRTTHEVFQTLQDNHGDPDERGTARREFKKFYQNNKPFSKFWVQFQRMAITLNMDEETQMDELREKVNNELKEKLITYQNPASIIEFVQYCIKTDARIKVYNEDLPKTQRSRSAANTTTAKTEQFKTPATREPLIKILQRPKELAPGQSPSSITCYNCGKTGHMSKDCPEPQKAVNNVQGLEYDPDDDADDDSFQTTTSAPPKN